MTTLQERLGEVMAARGWTHADVMRITGASSSLVSQWRGKGGKPIKAITNVAAALKLEAASGYSAVWIADGTGPKYPLSGPSAPISNQSKYARELAKRLDQIEDLDLFAAAYLAAVDAITKTIESKAPAAPAPAPAPSSVMPLRGADTGHPAGNSGKRRGA